MTGTGDFNARITDMAERGDLMSTTEQKASSPPAMVMISRRVNPGREGEYRRWVSRVIEEAEKFPNYLGATVLAPQPSGSDVFHLIHSFADEESLRAWMASEVMRRLSREADAFSSFGRQQATGMEAWFSLPDAPQLPPPPKWKMAIATFVGAYIVTAIAIPLEMRWLPHSWSFYETNIITNIIMAAAMTWAIMPGMSRLLRGWLYGSQDDTPVPVPAAPGPPGNHTATRHSDHPPSPPRPGTPGSQVDRIRGADT